MPIRLVAANQTMEAPNGRECADPMVEELSRLWHAIAGLLGCTHGKVPIDVEHHISASVLGTFNGHPNGDVPCDSHELHSRSKPRTLRGDQNLSSFSPIRGDRSSPLSICARMSSLRLVFAEAAM